MPVARRCLVASLRHVEIADDSGRATEFPFSRGVSFYEVRRAAQAARARCWRWRWRRWRVGRTARCVWQAPVPCVPARFTAGGALHNCFLQVNDLGQIVFARDIVEPAIKPGAAALSGISVVAPLVSWR